MNDVQYAMLNAIKQAETKKLTLYPEDFEKTHIWKDICDCLGISYNSPEVHIEFINVKTYEDD
jgi:RNA-binding protein YlmH